jgi:hypothetical protein
MTLLRKQFAHPDMESNTIKVGAEGGEELVIRPSRPTILTEEMGKWHGADQIHNWFTRNVRNGNKEQGEVIVTRAQLCKLLEDSREVVKRSYLIPSKSFLGRAFGKGASDETSGGQVIVDTSLARKLLPVSGRMLGRKYDEQYMYDLHHTITILLEALDASPDAYYSYRASW